MTADKIVHDLALLTISKRFTEAHIGDMSVDQLATETFDLYAAAFNAITRDRTNQLNNLIEKYQSL